ncbi:hypothetical protein DFQ27_002208 [Actinomortierella ambigua]|uniref:S-formylglutathione hydrolase n=1 Tax=Actinomortierella ambigua TaxID=1343610 RepID=A0A9P6U791_9FUNG|nr:hypothetical protein DFQ27_002208 [Actinomortierella ambigua]
MTDLQKLSSSKHFGGKLEKYSHQSSSTNCVMTFNIYLPEAAVNGTKVPVLYCLGGLTSSEENFATKAGAASFAAKYGLALVFPDTSPRNVDVPEAGVASDLGYGAGFYLTATQEPWAKNWNMYDYVAKELPALLDAQFPIDTKRQGITGHSMGGHGALTIFLKNQQNYTSISAFAPILHPTNCAWGQKAFPAYLGDDATTWNNYDTIHLLRRYVSENNLRKDFKALIDQGTGDVFLEKQLFTNEFIQATKDLGIESQFEVRFQDGYDHGYYFISTFVADHIDHHAKALGLTAAQ